MLSQCMSLLSLICEMVLLGLNIERLASTLLSSAMMSGMRDFGAS